ncbi:MAG: FxsA family protein [Bacteroidota bacterium]
MFARILLLLLVTPIVELALLLRVGQWIGFWPTIGIIVVTAVAGSVLLKQQGLSVWGTLQRRLQMGELPGTQIIDGVIILVAGALLVTPGVLTDFVGFAGLIPLTRIPIRKYIMRRARRSVERGTMAVGFGSFGSMGYDQPNPYGRSSSEREGWQGSARPTPGSAGEEPPDREKPL